MKAQEQVALLGAVGAPFAQRDERVGRPGHADRHPPPAQLVPQKHRDRQRHVLLPQAAREEHARIARIHAAVAGIDRHQVPPAQPVRQPPHRRSRRQQTAPLLYQPGPAPIVAIALGQERGQGLGDELEGDVHGVPDQEHRRRERLHLVVEEIDRRPEQESERLLGQSDLHPRLADRHGAPQSGHQERSRYQRNAAPVRPDRDALLALRRAHRDRPRRTAGEHGDHREDGDHRRPRSETARAVSRSAIRRFRSSRLSCCFLPFPRANATFARPFLK